MTRIAKAGSDSYHAFALQANLNDPIARAELAPAAMRAFLQISERWHLNNRQARALLGGVSSRRYVDWKSSRSPTLGQDALTRVSLLLGIYEALENYFGAPWARLWISLNNSGPVFAGRAPLTVMIDRGLPGMIEVRRILQAFSS